MLDFGFYNMDCMEGMKQFPDKYFDLAIVDPPYGAGFTENGGCKGWFSKYHQGNNITETDRGGKCIGTDLDSDLTDTSMKKMGKKSYRGMLPLKKNILNNFFASHGIKLYGAETILIYHQQDAL